MEQLIKPDARVAFSKIQAKVTLKITHQQLTSLIFMIRIYINDSGFSRLEERVICFHLLNLYEKKLRPKEMIIKSSYKIKLDIAQASALFNAINCIDVNKVSYEYNLIVYISTEIHRQLL